MAIFAGMAILYIYLAFVFLTGVLQLTLNLRFMAFALFVLTYPISPFILAAMVWKSYHRKAVVLLVAHCLALAAFGFLYFLTSLPAA
ncbi:MAG: hypothetical protein RBS33_14535 [Lentimicrobium sp.]|nr:hypothetical protein [Lentimicrobiaceae bacterium]MDY0027204.1 hypothetical protein [Lentimicrobium sp.]